MVIAADRLGLDALALSHALLHALWSEERDVTDPAVRIDVANRLGLDGARLQAMEDDTRDLRRLARQPRGGRPSAASSARPPGSTGTSSTGARTGSTSSTRRFRRTDRHDRRDRRDRRGRRPRRRLRHPRAPPRAAGDRAPQPDRASTPRSARRDPGTLSRAERAALAERMARHFEDARLAAAYAARLAAEDAPAAVRALADPAAPPPADARLAAILRHVDLVTLTPEAATAGDIDPAEGRGPRRPRHRHPRRADRLRELPDPRRRRAQDAGGQPVTAETVTAGPVTDFTLDPLEWHPHVTPVDLAAATPEQREALQVTPSNTKVSAYVLTLALDAEILKERTPLFNDIMYARGGLPRAERELGALSASIVNHCVYCAQVHATRFNQLSKRPEVVDGDLPRRPRRHAPGARPGDPRLRRQALAPAAGARRRRPRAAPRRRALRPRDPGPRPLHRHLRLGEPADAHPRATVQARVTGRRLASRGGAPSQPALRGFVRRQIRARLPAPGQARFRAYPRQARADYQPPAQPFPPRPPRSRAPADEPARRSASLSAGSGRTSR